MEPELCKVEIKEEIIFEEITEQGCIDGIEEESGAINDIEQENTCFDETHDQSFTSHISKEENISVNQIKKEHLNTIDVNQDEEFIKEEEEFDYIWPESTVKETDPLALTEINNKMDMLIEAGAIKKEIEDEVEVPVIWRQEDINGEDPLADVKAEEIEGVVIPNLVPKLETELIQSSTLLHDCPIKSEPNLLEELEVIKDLVPFEDIKPKCLPKEEDDLSNYNFQIEAEVDIKDVVYDLVPKVKTESPSRAVKQEDSKGVQSSGITLHCNESFISLNPLNKSSKMDNSRTRQVGCHRKSKMPADTNKSSPSHSEENPYSCNVCSFKCSQSGDLKRHMRSHTGEKAYSCNVCSFKCSQSGHLKRHMLTHTGEKPYSCNVCSFKCSRSSVLKTHMLTHTGEKPYSCNVCSFKCSQSGYLKIHMRTHTGENPYSCNVPNLVI